VLTRRFVSLAVALLVWGSHPHGSTLFVPAFDYCRVGPEACGLGRAMANLAASGLAEYAASFHSDSSRPVFRLARRTSPAATAMRFALASPTHPDPAAGRSRDTAAALVKHLRELGQRPGDRGVQPHRAARLRRMPACEETVRYRSTRP
jgi:hypothetical protein